MNATTTSLVTGASDGIGQALAAIWRGRGERVLGLGRRSAADVMDFDAEHYLQVDLAGQDAAQRVETFLEDQGVRRLDRLVHNAGVGWFGPVGRGHALPRVTEGALRIGLYGKLKGSRVSELEC